MLKYKSEKLNFVNNYWKMEMEYFLNKHKLKKLLVLYLHLLFLKDNILIYKIFSFL